MDQQATNISLLIKQALANVQHPRNQRRLIQKAVGGGMMGKSARYP